MVRKRILSLKDGQVLNRNFIASLTPYAKDLVELIRTHPKGKPHYYSLEQYMPELAHNGRDYFRLKNGVLLYIDINDNVGLE